MEELLKEIILTFEKFLEKHNIKIVMFDCEQKKYFDVPYVKYISLEVGKKDAIQFIYGSNVKITYCNAIAFVRELLIELKTSKNFADWCEKRKINPTDNAFKEYSTLCEHLESIELLLGASAIQELLSMDDIAEHSTGEVVS